ncbi:MAG: DUF1207 domain-containing protein [Gammaproteobacteria bacterium]|nr:DUF1207 domain-containing protein [Gammaproteobacteria bacterium]
MVVSTLQWVRWLVSVLMLLPVLARADLATEYLQGYARAVLDVQFSQYPVQVVAAHDDGRLVLSDAGCGPSDTRAAIETGFEATKRFARVLWQESDECVRAQAATIQPAAGTEAAVSKTETPATQTQQAQPLVMAIEALPVDELFKPLIADPRQPQFAIRYHRYKAAEDFNAASVSFGDYFGFASGVLEEYGISQIGLQGAVFAVFNLDAPSQDLINADYWIGVPLSFRRGPFSYLTRIYHQSSHLGDEFLLGDIGDLERVNLSYEDWETLVSYDWRKWRFYGGGGVILHSEPDIEPWHLQGGAEFRRPHFLGKFNLVAALDVQSTEEQDWHLNRSYQVGFAFGGQQGREVRLMLEHYRGFSPNGQFYTDRLRYTGAGVYFDF